MDVRYPRLPEGQDRIVYVRPVAVADLPDEVREQVGEEADVIYSVHSPDGARLALVANRQLAFHLARENNMVPVNVH